MLQLTNAQRTCFALHPIEDSWQEVRPKPSPYDTFETLCYVCGNQIKKVVVSGAQIFREYEVEERLSDDGTMLLPKTAKGKPVLFSSSNLLKRTAVGMHLFYNKGYISLYNAVSDQAFYQSDYTLSRLPSIQAFGDWVEDWCRNSDAAAMEDIQAFSRQPRKHVKYREGDFFRIKLDQNLYGYGRILVNYAEMRKKKIPFWDILAGKPLLVGVHHILTDDPNLTPDELRDLPVLPPCLMMDNKLYYGEYAIIGNEPVDASLFDCPVHYGTYYTIQDRTAKKLAYQCGKEFYTIPNHKGSFFDYRNGGIGWQAEVSVPVLAECIRTGSNAPYWEQDDWRLHYDLRNPKLSQELAEIRAQVAEFGEKQ